MLIAGLWLRHSAWDAVVESLERRGHRALPVALPGVDDAPRAATLDDQLAATLAVVDDAVRPMVVGHSAACSLAWMVADRRPGAIDRVVLVGGFPSADGETYADFFPPAKGLMPFPGWERFDGADSADLDQPTRERIGAGPPVPVGVSQGIVRLGDERRYGVPVLLVCPEYDPDQARAWIAGGDVPELTPANNVAYADIDSGHWPMFTRPVELAAILDAAAREG